MEIKVLGMFMVWFLGILAVLVFIVWWVLKDKKETVRQLLNRMRRKSYLSHVWFLATAKKNRHSALLHHASAWSYLTQEQWDVYIDALLKPLNIPKDKAVKVFEVGMGAGAALKRVHENFPKAVLAGVDPVASALKVAKNNLPEGNYQLGNGLNLKNQPSDYYDVVIAHCVIIYLNNLVEAKQFCLEMLRVAKPGALLMITSMIEEGGEKKGSANIKINKGWWQDNLPDATIVAMQTIGELPGCEHQGDRYAIYFQKNG